MVNLWHGGSSFDQKYAIQEKVLMSLVTLYYINQVIIRWASLTCSKGVSKLVS